MPMLMTNCVFHYTNRIIIIYEKSEYSQRDQRKIETEVDQAKNIRANQVKTNVLIDLRSINS